VQGFEAEESIKKMADLDTRKRLRILTVVGNYEKVLIASSCGDTSD
jgi:hypothetical protein